MGPLERTAEMSGGFDIVYGDRYLPSVQTAALITGSRQVAEEVVQDAFIQLLRSWGSVHYPVAWLRAAVISGCRSWQRRTVLERERAPRQLLQCSDPDGLAVRDALRVLTGRQRAAVVLRYFEDLPEAQIAEALGCRPGTVKSLLSRAMPRLREALDD